MVLISAAMAARAIATPTPCAESSLKQVTSHVVLIYAAAGVSCILLSICTSRKASTHADKMIQVDGAAPLKSTA